jgi:hypothetical protein
MDLRRLLRKKNDDTLTDPATIDVQGLEAVPTPPRPTILMPAVPPLSNELLRDVLRNPPGGKVGMVTVRKREMTPLPTSEGPEYVGPKPSLLEVAVAALATEKTLEESMPVPDDDEDAWTIPKSMLPRALPTPAEKAAVRKKVKAARKAAHKNRRRG